jgi:hypothetical protein
MLLFAIIHVVSSRQDTASSSGDGMPTQCQEKQEEKREVEEEEEVEKVKLG